MKINCFIGTYNQIDLAIGAAKSLRKNLLQEVVITLICANKLYSDPIFDTSIHIPFPRWCGYMASRTLS
jgi:hypothetical protein